MSPDFSQIQHRDYAIPASAINAKARTVELSFSSEEPYERWYGVEILDHRAEAVDLDRLNNGAAVLVDHERGSQVGVVERAWLGDDRKGRATVRFSKSPKGQEIFDDVQDGIRKLVSVGYRVDDFVLESKTDSGAETYRVTRWQPFEISIVSVPADSSVGVGRALSPNLGNKTMTTNENTADSGMSRSERRNQNQAIADERTRVVEINAIGEQHGLSDMANAAIRDGLSLARFRKMVLDQLTERGTLRPAESPDLGLSRREVENYSFRKAILAQVDPKYAQREAGLEMEASRAEADRVGKAPQGLYVPTEVLRRDLTVGTAADGGNLVATNLLAGSFIDLLRNAMMVRELGATVLDGLRGNIAIPRQSATGTAFWVAEGAAPTESQAAFAQVAMEPHTVAGFSDFTRKLLLQSTPDIESLVRRDLAAVIALAIDLAAINGSGTGEEPEGILNTSGVGSVAIGTNGGAPTWDHIVDLLSAVANANADVGNLAFLTNAKVRGKLLKTQKFASTDGTPVWETTSDGGRMAGYRAAVSNQVPSDLDKGTSTGVCSAIVFGNWSDLFIGQWSGLDILADPYTFSSSGTIRVVAAQDVDISVRHPQSFAVIADALTS